MRKIFVVAQREYFAAVRSKAFVISLIVLPLLMGMGPLVQKLTKNVGDTRTRRLAVIDRTADAKLLSALQSAADERNAHQIFDSTSGRQNEPRYEIAPVAASRDDPDAIARQRFDLSEQIRRGELFAFLEIGREVIKPAPGLATRPVTDLTDDLTIRYSTASPTYLSLQQWAQQVLITAVTTQRVAAAGLGAEKLKSLLAPPILLPRGLYVKSASGAIVAGAEPNPIAAFLLPIALAVLMYIVVLIGASPMAMNVIEEKQMRIAEVLLGSLRPFELMMGKLLGGVGVAATLGAIYLGGAMWLARQQHVLQLLSMTTLIWFLVFLVLGVLMYGSLFVAVGAAASNVKEAQALIMPAMIVIVMPMMILSNLLQYPNGPLAMAFTFFPLSAPIITITRLAIPPGMPSWQPVVSLMIALLTTLGMVWAAGRIFRVGILMQGQGAKLGDMLKWIVKE